MAPARDHLPTRVLWLLVSAAVLGAVGSAVGLLTPRRVYGQETPALLEAAVAQDLVNLFLVVPLLLVLAPAAARGRLRCWLCLIGALAFTAYNYAIYAFSVHFGPLFLVWVAVLGLSFYSLAGCWAALDKRALQECFHTLRCRLAAWFLIAAAVLFGFLWLREVAADLIEGRPSTSAQSWNVPTNPVHVLDLAIFLPAVAAGGVALLRGRGAGYGSAPGFLLFLVLTTLPPLVIPFVTGARGGVTLWSAALPLAVVALLAAGVLWRLLFLMRQDADRHPERSLAAAGGR